MAVGLKNGPLSGTVELYQWHPEWSLSSMDSHCVVARLALEVCGIPCKLLSCDTPSMSPTNALPFIRQDYDTLYAGDDILQFAVDNATRDIAVLTEEQQIDCRAILALIEDSVIPAIYHMLWCDQENFSEATLPAYEKAYTWPLSLYIPHKMRTRMITNIHDVTGGASAEEIVTAATDACGTIADYLEDQRYLFGDKPHALDAVVYGHLSFILNCPMRNEALKLGVLSRSALTRYLRASLVSR